MALRWDAVGMPPGDYSAIVADIVLFDHRIGCSSILLRAECSNSSGSGSLLQRILGSAFVGGVFPLPVRAFLQIHCRGHFRGDPCLVVYAPRGLEVSMLLMLLFLVILGLGGGSLPWSYVPTPIIVPILRRCLLLPGILHGRLLPGHHINRCVVGWDNSCHLNL